MQRKAEMHADVDTSTLEEAPIVALTALVASTQYRSTHVIRSMLHCD